MFNLSSQTPYDLRFTLFGIPVQVHPFFWLTSIFLGLGIAQGENGTQLMLCWMIAVFIGVLVHELGHALTIRYIFGGYPRIVLYGLGGAAMHSPYYSKRTPRMWGRILISFSGPLFGFLLAGFCLMLVILLKRLLLQADFHQVSASWFLLNILFFLVFIGFFWGVINLLPVLPMDGGQICREICLRFSPWRGDLLALQISIFTAVGVAILGFYLHQTFLAIMFGIMAYMNYQSLTFGRY